LVVGSAIYGRFCDRIRADDDSGSLYENEVEAMPSYLFLDALGTVSRLRNVWMIGTRLGRKCVMGLLNFYFLPESLGESGPNNETRAKV